MSGSGSSALSTALALWWVIGIAIVALVLIALGRYAGRTRIAGQMPRDQGPDLEAVEKGKTPDMSPDIAADDENQTTSRS